MVQTTEKVQTGNIIKVGGSLPEQQIEQTLQTKGHKVGDIFLVQLNRTDLSVTGPNGHPFKPPFAPKHIFFFQPLENGKAFMNAEFTFKESEMTPVLDAIFANGLEVMAEHQHYIGSKPQGFHYHFRGMDEPEKLAQSAVNVVKATSTPLPQQPPSNPQTPLPKDQIASILGGTAMVHPDGIVSVGVVRNDRFTEDGVELTPHTNVLQKISIEPLDSNGNQALYGADFCMLGREVMPVLTTVRKMGWQVHCLYNQQTEVHPQLFFSHTLKWGDPIQLAKEVRQALDKTDTKK